MLEDPAARISTLLDCLNAVEEAHTALEFRFRETIGLARALEAVDSSPAVAAIAARIRKDYEATLATFQELASKADRRFQDEHEQRAA